MKDKSGSTTFVSPLYNVQSQRLEKKLIMCMTDAFFKYVEVVAIPDKSAPTVGSALFSRWLCVRGLPFEIISDNKKELCIENIQYSFNTNEN